MGWLLVLAGACWLGCLLCLRLWLDERRSASRGAGDAPSRGAATQAGRATLLWLFTGWAALRLPGWLLAPHQSDDIYRYLWDGAVQAAGLSPYLGSPEDPAYAAVRAAIPDVFARINHRELPTIYPPAAQLLFRLSQAVSRATHLTPLWTWKGLCAVADAGVLGVLWQLCRRLGVDPRWTAAWALCPLCGVEIAQNAHLDVLGVLGLCLALLLWLQGRPLRAGVALAAAALVKPVALLLWFGVRGPGRRRLLYGLGLGAAALVLPFAAAGRRLPGSLGEYGRRWRGNEGVFALLQAGADRLCGWLYRPPYDDPWRLRWLAHLITGRDRDAVYPDELSGFVARGTALLLLLGWIAYLQRRRPALSAPELTMWLLGGYLILTPVLHPWYVLWVLGLCPLTPGVAAPWLLLAALAPLGYLPQGFSRLIEHGLPLLAAGWLLRREN